MNEVCNCWWEYCSEDGTEDIVCGSHGGYFGRLCPEHADALERNLARGKKENEAFKERHR